MNEGFDEIYETVGLNKNQSEAFQAQVESIFQEAIDFKFASRGFPSPSSTFFAPSNPSNGLLTGRLFLFVRNYASVGDPNGVAPPIYVPTLEASVAMLKHYLIKDDRAMALLGLTVSSHEEGAKKLHQHSKGHKRFVLGTLVRALPDVDDSSLKRNESSSQVGSTSEKEVDDDKDLSATYCKFSSFDSTESLENLGLKAGSTIWCVIQD